MRLPASLKVRLADSVYRVIGRASLILHWLHSTFLIKGSRRIHKSGICRLDKTGLIVDKAQRLPVFWDDNEVFFPDYEMLPYAFARAQEFSLFRMYKSYLAPPLVDFGCGDGSFAAMLFESVDFGIDNDPEPLKIAVGYGVYAKMIESDDKGIPLESSSIQSVMSNSVLEHVIDIDACLKEICRIMRTGGCFLFTVPLVSYRDDLAKYFGRRASARLNKEAYHRNLLTPEEWRHLLKKHGFEILLERQYQPDWFSFWCETLRLTGRTGFGMFVPGLSTQIRKHYRRQLVEAVRKSVLCTEAGGNTMFIVRKL